MRGVIVWQKIWEVKTQNKHAWSRQVRGCLRGQIILLLESEQLQEPQHKQHRLKPEYVTHLLRIYWNSIVRWKGSASMAAAPKAMTMLVRPMTATQQRNALTKEIANHELGTSKHMHTCIICACQQRDEQHIEFTKKSGGQPWQWRRQGRPLKIK